MDQAMFNMLLNKLDEVQQENELPYEIKNCETDLLIDIIPTFVNMDNFLNYPIAEVKCSRDLFRSYTVIVLDAYAQHKKGDYIYAVGNENLFQGEIIKIEKYSSKLMLPYEPSKIIFAPQGKVVQPPKNPETSLFGSRVYDAVHYDPFCFDFSGYGAIAKGAFSCFDPLVHNDNEFNPEVLPKDPFRCARKLILPENIRIIGRNAFSYRSDLDEIFIRNEKAIILDGAFSYCGNLRYVSLPSKTVVIHSGSFYKCFSLLEVFIPASVMAIESDAFRECISLSTVAFMRWSKLEIIGNGAFEKTNLEVVDLSVCNNLKEIKTFAFRGCKRLKKVYVHSRVKIHRFAFLDCPEVVVIGANDSICEEDWDTIGTTKNDKPIKLKR